MLREVTVTRYVTPLREGGSLPGLMEADDLGSYVVKFTGAGQGRKALIAEIVCAALARELDLAVPELVLVDLDPALADNEPDEEVQDLLRRSPGRNLGIDFLPGSIDLDVRAFAVDPSWAGRVLWFDAFVGNVDRSWRNPNLLFWHGAPYLIDHGAALTFHHAWSGADGFAARAYDANEHALLGVPPDLAHVGALADRFDDDTLARAVAQVPDEWLADEPGFATPADVRTSYVDVLRARLATDGARLDALREAVASGGTPIAPRRGNRPSWLGGTP